MQRKKGETYRVATGDAEKKAPIRETANKRLTPGSSRFNIKFYNYGCKKKHSRSMETTVV